MQMRGIGKKKKVETVSKSALKIQKAFESKVSAAINRIEENFFSRLEVLEQKLQEREKKMGIEEPAISKTTLSSSNEDLMQTPMKRVVNWREKSPKRSRSRITANLKSVTEAEVSESTKREELTQEIGHLTKKSDQPRVMFLQHNYAQRSLAKLVTLLGGVVLTTFEDAPTHVVSIGSKCGRRTEAFVALLKGIPIVADRWIHQSTKSNKWLDAGEFSCSDILRKEISRKGILEEFRNANVGLLGMTESDVDDFTSILKELGCKTRSLKFASKRTLFQLEILVLRREGLLKSIKETVKEMGALRLIITAQNLKSIIWEGAKDLYRNLVPSRSENPTDQIRNRIAMPYLLEIVLPDGHADGKLLDEKRIYPLSHPQFRSPNWKKFPPLRVGKSASMCDYVLPYEGVSRLHFELQLVDSTDGLQLCIEDKGSTNGLFVNNVKVASKEMLRENDLIFVGGGAGIPAGSSIDASMIPEYSAKYLVRRDHTW